MEHRVTPTDIGIALSVAFAWAVIALQLLRWSLGS